MGSIENVLLLICACIICLIGGIAIGKMSIDDLNSERKKDDDDDFSIKEKESDESTKQTITVYNTNGEIIKQYRSCLDVEGDQYSIIFEDEKGKEHEIYYSSGIVCVDEE